jgi:hypothetical protein
MLPKVFEILMSDGASGTRVVCQVQNLPKLMPRGLNIETSKMVNLPTLP